MSLADPTEPLILADGTKIDPSTGKVIKEKQSAPRFMEIPSPSEAQAIVARTRRSIAELPLPPQQMNTISLCLFYTMFGLADQDIAIVLKLSAEQVGNIKKLPQYQSISQDIQNAVLEHEAGDIRTFFQAKAGKAAQKIADIAEDDDGVLGFKASQDILDRAGHRPADVVEHKHKFEDSLKIEYIKRDAPTSIPMIEGEFRDITNG